MHPMIQKTLFLLCAGILAATQATAADPYPDHPVRIIDGYSAGGGTDYVARYLASKMDADFGGSVIVEIDDKDWNGLSVTAADQVRIEGEVEHKRDGRVEIEVDRIVKL